MRMWFNKFLCETRKLGFMIGAAFFLTLGLVFFLVSPSSAQKSVVSGVMFWQQGCPHCELVISETLPAIKQQFGDQFQLEMIEVSSLEDVDHLFAVGQAYGLEKQDVGVPMVVVGDDVLIGSIQIPAELPGLIQSYLASGGVQTVLRDTANQTVSAVGPVAVEPPVVEQAAEQASNGMWLAWITIVLLALVFLAAGWQVIAALQGGRTFVLPGWADWLVPTLAVAGSLIAIYLTFIETTKAKAICGPVGDCNAVQNSPYALLFGLIPVGLVGLAGYVAILAAWFWKRYRQDALADYAPLALFGMAMIGVVFSVYLTYLEIFVIHAVCIWCISSAWIMAFLLLLTTPEAVVWVSGSEPDDRVEEPA